MPSTHVTPFCDCSTVMSSHDQLLSATPVPHWGGSESSTAKQRRGPSAVSITDAIASYRWSTGATGAEVDGTGIVVGAGSGSGAVVGDVVGAVGSGCSAVPSPSDPQAP